MGQDVTFRSNGHEATGYFAPAPGGGPGVLVIQEWWGVVPHIRDVCDRLAAAGFSALSPDLYHGASTTEPDEAGKLMMSLNLDRAGTDMSGAVDFLLGAPEVTGSKLGVVGFCMGGALALMVATQRPDAIAACAPYYGVVGWLDPQPDWTKLNAVVRGHVADRDDTFTVDMFRDLEARLTNLGQDATFIVHEGTDHAFFNDTRPDVYAPEASAAAWADTLDLFATTLVDG
jgi:carboxymethylenebutenolidase